MLKNFLFLIVLFLSSVVFADNTVNPFGNTVEVTDFDSDWFWSSMFNHPLGMKIISIKFYPGAIDDKVIIKDGSDTGPIMCKLESSDGEPRYDMSFKGGYYKPVIDYGDSTFTAGSSVIFIIP
jgi:hypothetical protein